MNAKFVKIEDDGLVADVDLGVYSLTALLKVAYQFTARCYLHLQRRDENSVEVRFRSKDNVTNLESLAGEFCNALLDQTLREIVSRESEAERNLILAHALSRTTLIHPELETEEPNPIPRVERPVCGDSSKT